MIVRRTFANAAANAFFAAGLLMHGCSSTPKPVEVDPASIHTTLRVVHHLGGTHYRTHVHDGIWYQTFGSALLVINPANADVIRTIPLGKSGECGPAIDMAITGQRMFVVIEDDAIVELSLAVPEYPTIVTTTSAEALGILPRMLSEIDTEVYASGRGGVVRLSDLSTVFTTDESAGRVAVSDGALAVCVGRRVLRIADGQFLGTATDLLNMPTGLGHDGQFIFQRQNDSGTLIGLMTPDIREVDTRIGTIAAPDPGIVRRARMIDGRLWVITDAVLVEYELRERELVPLRRISILGARDLDLLGPNRLAVSGTFGRAMCELPKAASVEDATFTNIHREPGRLERAVSDGRNVLAGSAEGAWMYLISARVELTSRPMRNAPLPSTAASILEGTAKVVDGGQAVLIARAGEPEWRYQEPRDARIRCAVAVDGDFWLGHDRGITVIRGQTNPAMPMEAFTPVSVRIPGPVHYIFPLLVGGGASFVSEFGGIGVVKFIEEPAAMSRPN